MEKYIWVGLIQFSGRAPSSTYKTLGSFYKTQKDYVYFSLNECIHIHRKIHFKKHFTGLFLFKGISKEMLGPLWPCRAATAIQRQWWEMLEPSSLLQLCISLHSLWTLWLIHTSGADGQTRANLQCGWRNDQSESSFIFPCRFFLQVPISRDIYRKKSY